MADNRARPTKCDFFVSYTQADRRWAEWVAWELEAAGYSVLFQGWDFVPGTNWVRMMQDGISNSARIVVILSPDYIKSVFGAVEWQTVWASDPEGAQRRLIPIRVSDCERPGLLAGIVGIDLFGIPQREAAQRLQDAIMGVMAGRAKPRIPPTFPDLSESFTVGESSPPLLPPPGYAPVPPVRPQFPEHSSRESAIAIKTLTILWIIGIIGMPYIIVPLPYTYRRIRSRRAYAALVVYAVTVVVLNIRFNH